MSPVQAHYTLGLNTGTPPYHVSDFDPHVTGVIGYVWPGSGENAYAGAPGFVSSSIPPGYIAPWADNGVNPPGALPTWYQLAGNAYAPFGAVLVNSTGDLIFAINATAGFTGTWGSLDILIPPEFGNIKTEQVVTTLTNDYSGITVNTLDQFDRYAPGWTLVTIWPDGNENGAVPSMVTFSSKGEWYYVRINGVMAPAIAGKYFFKMFLGGNGPSGECGAPCAPDYWVPTANWPVMLVKGETDPAIIYGTIFYGGYNQSLYGKPIELAGMVKAVMTTKLDPYTGNTMTGPLTNAVGYFNSTAMGHYEVEGVAPGVYDIYASAAGYPLQLIATGVRVLKGQSLMLNGYLNPGVVIQGNVYTKHGFGEEPWPRTDYIKIEIYSTNPTVNVGSPLPAANSKLVSWSPLPCVTAGPGANYIAGSNDASDCGGTWSGNTGYSYVAFPWVEYGNPYFNPTITTNPNNNQFNGVYFKPPVDEQGVGPAQQWFVQGGTTIPFSFQFGEKGEYGAPSILDGHVPQMNATWIDGLQAGRYYVRAWVTQYVQTELDGLTFHEVSFDVAANEWAGDVVVPIDLRLTDYVNKTVYFHDTPGTLMTNPISTGATVLDGGLYDAATGKVLWAWNYTTTFFPNGIAFITWYGFNKRWDGRDYGIPAGTYIPKIYAKGYEQQTFEMVSLSLSGTPVYISDHLYRGVGFNITIYSTDFEQPRVDRNWLYPGQYIDLVIYNEPGHNVSATRTKFAKQVLGTTTTKCDTGAYASQCVNGVWWGYQSGNAFFQGGVIGETDVFNEGSSPSWSKPSAFDSGQYSFSAGTYGYVQKKTFSVYALKGQIADIKINLVIGVNLTILIDFKKEKILTPTLYNMAARVRVFDDSGKLVGEWMTSEGFTENGITTNYIPAGTSTATIHIAGLPWNYGDPVFDQGGFHLGDNNFTNLGIDGSPNYNGGYSVEVDFVNWYNPMTTVPLAGLSYYPPPPGLLMGESFHTVPGHPQNPFGWTEVGALAILKHSMAPNHLGPYAQEGVWSLPNAHLSGESSGEWEVDLRGYLAGTVVGFTWSGEYRTQSWATVSIFGADNYTYNSYSSDGYYEFYTAPGAYKMTISQPGYASQTFPLVVGEGQITSGGNLQLQQSNLPIPEFSGLAVVAFSALAASLYLLRRRRP